MTKLKEAKLYGDEVISSPYGTIELEHTYIGLAVGGSALLLQRDTVSRPPALADL